VICREWIGIKCWSRTGVLLQLLANLFNDVLNLKFVDPSRDISGHEVVVTFRGLIETDGSSA
jgi:hypothetical protein